MSVQDTFSNSSALIEQVQLQDPAAWKRFANLYGPLVYYWGRQFGLNPDDASDLAQDVFHTLWKRIDGYSSGNFRGWLLIVTKNVFRDRWRKDAQLLHARGGSDAQLMFDQIPDPLKDSSSQQNQQDESELLLLHRALEMIRDDFQESTWSAFWRMAIQNESAASIAESLKITESSVRHAKFRVLKRLKEELGRL
ncbi:MAG: sigma-70 family RNA polymerase sigma factor [Planctomycetaceae bacterium]|nr:sigma-70 family RNA polymerase sigma factor [Planctomycetaceae bacterium]